MILQYGEKTNVEHGFVMDYMEIATANMVGKSIILPLFQKEDPITYQTSVLYNGRTTWRNQMVAYRAQLLQMEMRTNAFNRSDCDTILG